MDTLDLNRLKTLSILIVFSFFSCQKIGEKDSTINIITLKGYEADKINKVTFYKVLKDSTLVSMKIDKILKFTNPKLDDFGSIDIYLNKYILPTKKYKLVLNDTNEYFIDDFKMDFRTYMVGNRLDTTYFLKSYKINNYLVDSLYNTRLEIQSNFNKKK